MNGPVSVMLPMRNEAATVGEVVSRLRRSPAVAEILAVDNASSDESAAIARRAGARVVTEPAAGLGAVVRRGLRAAAYDHVVKVDADLLDFTDDLVERLLGASNGPDIRLVKGKWVDPDDDMPMTRRLIQPALRHLYPGLSGHEAPNSGIYLIDRRAVAVRHLPDGYAVDIDVMLRIHSGGWRVVEADIGMLHNNPRTTDHYTAMADTIFGLFLERARQEPLRPIVAIAPRSEDIISGCLGTLSNHLGVGGRVLLCITDEDADVARRRLVPLLDEFPTAALTTRALPARLPAAAFEHGLTVISAAESDAFVDRWLQCTPALDGNRLRRYTLPPAVTGHESAAFSPAFSVDISPQLELKRLCCAGLPPGDARQRTSLRQACAASEYWGDLAGVDAAEVFASAASPHGPPRTRTL
ncbi:MAG: glycosyltransferase [Anaerolineales bacterium]|nr:glycosyltransferase [Anaerolineales bacterium]